MQRRPPPRAEAPPVPAAAPDSPPRALTPGERRRALRRTRYDPTDYFITFVMINLSGYAVLGRAYAYIGIPPLYVNEMMILFGLAGIILFRPLVGLLRMPCLFPVLLWILSGIIVLIAQEDQPIDFMAIRDSVTWAYSIIAIVIFMMFYRNPERLERFLRWYAFHISWVVPAGALLLSSQRFVELPPTPWIIGADVIMASKQSDLSIQVGGAMVAVLCGLVRVPPWVMAANFLGWLSLATLGRAGIFNALLAILICMILMRRRFNLGKPVMIALVIIATAAPLSFLVPDSGNHPRKFNAEQVVQNFVSVFGDSGHQQLSDTTKFRKLWWASVLDHSIYSEDHWLLGLGFGFSLAELAPFEVEKEVRSPHNVVITIAGRMGVLGLATLGFLLLSWGFMMIRTYLRAKANGERRIEAFSIWLMAMFAAMIFNGATDVALEGPVAACWFWTVFGLGCVISTVRETPRADRVIRRRVRAAS